MIYPWNKSDTVAIYGLSIMVVTGKYAILPDLVRKNVIQLEYILLIFFVFSFTFTLKMV